MSDTPEYRYARGILVSFVHEYCNPVPEWKPCDDLIGVLTQLDSAMTVVRPLQSHIRELEGAVECARQAIEYSIDMGGTDPGGVLLQTLNKCDAALSSRDKGNADE